MDLAIDAGVQLIFRNNVGMRVRHDVSLEATGTSGSQIVFSGEDKTAGSWNGLYFDLTTTSNTIGENRFDYVVFEFGGGYAWQNNMEGNLLFNGNSAQTSGRLVAEIHDCTFRNSETCGIYYDNSNIYGLTQYTSISNDLQAENTFGPGNDQDICYP